MSRSRESIVAKAYQISKTGESKAETAKEKARERVREKSERVRERKRESHGGRHGRGVSKDSLRLESTDDDEVRHEDEVGLLPGSCHSCFALGLSRGC